MSLTIKKQLVTDLSNSYRHGNSKKYITVHETANTQKGANAQAHANLQSRGFANSFHWQIDDKEAIQSYPHSVRCWHAGDGRGPGNTESIAIEICVNADGDFGKAVDNAAKLIRKIMSDEGISLLRVVQHNHWSGKNCPAFLRSGSKGVDWSYLISKVKGEDAPKKKPKKEKPSPRVLRLGHSGSDVRKLQEELISLGYSLPKYGADGSFGNETDKAVRHLQESAGIAVDGVVGKGTRQAIANKVKPKSKGKANIKVDGKWGKDTTRALQRALGTTVDGIISRQPRNSVTQALYGGTVSFGSGNGSPVVRALQRKVGAKADGKLGPDTVRKLQKYLGTARDGKLSRPSAAVKEMQRRLNAGTF